MYLGSPFWKILLVLTLLEFFMRIYRGCVDILHSSLHS